MRATILASLVGGIVHLFFHYTGQCVIVMRVITLITQVMMITLMVLVLIGNADCSKISLSLISRSLRASEVPATGNHLLLSLHTTCYDRRAVYRTIILHCISSSSIVITFNFAVSGALAR